MNTIYGIYQVLGGDQATPKMPGWMILFFICLLISTSRLCAACFLDAASIKRNTWLTRSLALPAALGFMSSLCIHGLAASMFLTLVLLPSAGAPIGAVLPTCLFGILSNAIFVSRFFRGVYA